MIWYIVLVLAFDLQSAISQVTKRENVLLSRKKRYLFFPPGANFVVSIYLHTTYIYIHIRLRSHLIRYRTN